MAARRVLSFGQSSLNAADVDTLVFPNWLNDSVLNFVVDLFKLVKFKENGDKVAFAYPGTAFIISIGDEEDVELSLSSGNIDKEKRLVCIPLNDHSNPLAAGGSHWSLLVFDNKLGCFVHYDSSANGNGGAAEKLARKLHPHLVGGEWKDAHLRVARGCPQQDNSSDCGVFALMFAEHLARMVVEDPTRALHDQACFDELAKHVSPAKARVWRQETLKLVQSMAGAGEAEDE